MKLIRDHAFLSESLILGKFLSAYRTLVLGLFGQIYPESTLEERNKKKKYKISFSIN